MNSRFWNIVASVMLAFMLTMPISVPAFASPASDEWPLEIPDDYVIPTPRDDGNLDLQALSSLPTVYDSRANGWVTPVRSQRPHNLCWAFSACAAGEASLVRKGWTDTDVDLSEMHLGAFFEGRACDSLGLCAGDETWFLGEDYLTVGNNNKFTTFALANWVGLASEAAYPYSEDLSGAQTDRGLGTDDVAHLRNAFWISASNRQLVKKAIMDYGAVGLSFYQRDNNFNSETNAYYNGLYTSTNHAVTVVGWDDEFPAEGFLGEPDGNGAWLVKNSLGTDWGDGGYFWLSYYDASVSSPSAIAFVFDFEPADAYDHNYHYDGSYGTRTYELSAGGSVGACFTASANGENDEELDAVGIAIATQNVSYIISVYTGITDSADPRSGTLVDDATTKGVLTEVGFHTIDLAAPVTLHQSETFAVVVTLDGQGLPVVPIFVDQSYENGNWITFIASSQQNETLVEGGDGRWKDLHDLGMTARIKAYTTNLPYSSLYDLRFDVAETTLVVGEHFFQPVVVEPDDCDMPQIIWSSSNDEVATVDDDGNVVAISDGDAIITAIDQAGGREASYLVTVSLWDGLIAFEEDKAEGCVGTDLAFFVRTEPKVSFDSIAIEVSPSGMADVEGNILHLLSAGDVRVVATYGGKSATLHVHIVSPSDLDDLDEPGDSEVSDDPEAPGDPDAPDDPEVPGDLDEPGEDSPDHDQEPHGQEPGEDGPVLPENEEDADGSSSDWTDDGYKVSPSDERQQRSLVTETGSSLIPETGDVSLVGRLLLAAVYGMTFIAAGVALRAMAGRANR